CLACVWPVSAQAVLTTAGPDRRRDRHLLRVYHAFARYGLVGSPTGLILAHTCIAVSFVVTSVSASLAGINPRLEQAANAQSWRHAQRHFFLIMLPHIRISDQGSGRRPVCLHHLVRRTGCCAVHIRLWGRPAKAHVGRFALSVWAHHRRGLNPTIVPT